MTFANIRVDGVAALNASLARLDPQTRAQLRTYVARATGELAERTRANIASTFRSAGVLAGAVKSEVTESGGAISGRVFVDGVPYAAIQEYGGQTAPHEIAPVKAKALAFAGGGGTVFAKHVHHPGSHIPERSYARMALAAMRGVFADGVRAATVDALETSGLLA